MEKTELLKRIGECVPEQTLRTILNEWDPVIRVNRRTRPTYPNTMKKVKHPELELTGPTEFDVRTLKPWSHPKQKSGNVANGDEIIEELTNGEMLINCLGLTDLQAIEARGTTFFQKYFSNTMIFGWKSTILSFELCVPSLHMDGNKMFLGWHRLHAVLTNSHTLLFPS